MFPVLFPLRINYSAALFLKGWWTYATVNPLLNSFKMKFSFTFVCSRAHWLRTANCFVCPKSTFNAQINPIEMQPQPNLFTSWYFKLVSVLFSIEPFCQLLFKLTQKLLIRFQDSFPKKAINISMKRSISLVQSKSQNFIFDAFWIKKGLFNIWNIQFLSETII